MTANFQAFPKTFCLEHEPRGCWARSKLLTQSWFYKQTLVAIVFLGNSFHVKETFPFLEKVRK